jgi:hypothetical protein
MGHNFTRNDLSLAAASFEALGLVMWTTKKETWHEEKEIAKEPVQLRIGFDEKLLMRVLACGAALSAHKAVTFSTGQRVSLKSSGLPSKSVQDPQTWLKSTPNGLEL